MKIKVVARPNAKKDELIPPGLTLLIDAEFTYVAYVKEPPVNNRANEAIIRLLADYFNVSRSQVTLISGAHSKKKVFEIVAENG